MSQGRRERGVGRMLDDAARGRHPCDVVREIDCPG